MDVLIAAVALEHRASVFTLDNGFSRIARLTGLPLSTEVRVTRPAGRLANYPAA
jgi:hypothetical protein